MNSAEIIARLKPLEAKLRARGMDALYLFGSAARGEASPKSDVDLMCDIHDTSTVDLFDFFALQREIESELHTTVELSERTALLPLVREFAEREMVRIF
jgi:uncharacterized protein